MCRSLSPFPGYWDRISCGRCRDENKAAQHAFVGWCVAVVVSSMLIGPKQWSCLSSCLIRSKIRCVCPSLHAGTMHKAGPVWSPCPTFYSNFYGSHTPSFLLSASYSPISLYQVHLVVSRVWSISTFVPFLSLSLLITGGVCDTQSSK